MRSVSQRSALIAAHFLGAVAIAFIVLWVEEEPRAPSPTGAPVLSRNAQPEALVITAGRSRGLTSSVLATRGQPTALSTLGATQPLSGAGALVRDSISKAPLGGVQAWIEGSKERETSDASGRFFIGAAPDRAVRILMRAPRYEPAVLEIRTQLGRSIQTIVDLKPAKTGRIEGVIEVVGSPPDRLMVFLDMEPTELPWEGGRFTLDPVNVGPHVVGLGGRDKARGVILTYQRVEVREGEGTQVHLALKAQVEIAGRVRDERGEPLAFAKLFFQGIAVVADRDGRFATDVIPVGEYPIIGFHEEYGHVPLGSLILQEGQPRRDLDFVLRPQGSASIEGQLVGSRNAGVTMELYELVQRAPVRLRLAEQATFVLKRTAPTDGQGAFRFPNLMAGRYKVNVRGRSLAAEVILAATARERVELGAE